MSRQQKAALALEVLLVAIAVILGFRANNLLAMVPLILAGLLSLVAVYPSRKSLDQLHRDMASRDSSKALDPRKLKQYRKAHPGKSILDAIHEAEQ